MYDEVALEGLTNAALRDLAESLALTRGGVVVEERRHSYSVLDSTGDHWVTMPGWTSSKAGSVPAKRAWCTCDFFTVGGLRYCPHIALVEEEERLLVLAAAFEDGMDDLADLESRRAERPVGRGAFSPVTRQSHPDPLGIEGRACAFAEYREGCQCERCQKRAL